MHTHFGCFNQNGNVFLLFFPNCPGADAETEEKRGTEGMLVESEGSQISD